MRIPKNIFQTVKEQVEFLVFLNSKSFFTISEVTSKVKTEASILSRKIPFWENEGFIKRKTKSGTHGGYQYQFSFTPKARNELTKLLTLLLDALKIKDRLIRSLKQLDDDKKEKIYSQITNFFELLINE
ncbi:hypothetical protein LCGC14_2878660 [marine sediment metagenome]|uniref:HTH marR-type domain-containing protein n=1 Tax=marine sediment metagenome TaxID=412755 RepID=A0A0F9A8W9_9ZZZZ